MRAATLSGDPRATLSAAPTAKLRCGRIPSDPCRYTAQATLSKPLATGGLPPPRRSDDVCPPGPPLANPARGGGPTAPPAAANRCASRQQQGLPGATEVSDRYSSPNALGLCELTRTLAECWAMISGNPLENVCSTLFVPLQTSLAMALWQPAVVRLLRRPPRKRNRGYMRLSHSLPPAPFSRVCALPLVAPQAAGDTVRDRGSLRPHPAYGALVRDGRARRPGVGYGLCSSPACVGRGECPDTADGVEVSRMSRSRRSPITAIQDSASPETQVVVCFPPYSGEDRSACARRRARTAARRGS